MLNKLKSYLKTTAKAVLLPILGWRFRDGLKAYESPYRLHLGCGYHHLDGWVNIDFIDTPAVDVTWNLGQPIPLSNNCCAYIFHEHVLEHFDLGRGLDLLAECYRLLEKGGVLRVAMPCLESIVEAYGNGEWENADTEHMPNIKTGAEYINTMFRAWGHRWIYDHQELERRLTEVGFDVIVRKEIGQSDYDSLSNIEYRSDSDLIVEAVK